jgi:nitrite reductase (NADH) large subunit
MTHDCEVHVVHLGKHLMNMQLDAPGGAILKSSMEKLGVTVHLEKSTAAVLGDDCVTGLAFKDGSTLACDMVVIAAGIRPNAEIGVRAGLTVGRAIVVDNHMRSVDDANVYALGECAQHRGQVYGLVAPLWEQGKVFADHITQRNLDAAYYGPKLATKLKVMGVELASMGITDPVEGDELIQFTEPKKGIYKKLIVRDGRLVGGILMGDISKAAYLMQAFDRDAPLPEERLSLLFDFGAPSQKITIDEMPADMQVCNCNGVTKAALGACVAAGNRTTKAAMDASRAGKSCGSCKNLVAEVVLWFCGGEVEEDPSIHYYVPGVPLTKLQLIAAARDQGLKSVSSVFKALAGGLENAASKPALASLLATIWNDEYEDERDARFINDRVHGNIQKDGTFSVVPEMPGGVCTPDELMRIAGVAVKYKVPLVNCLECAGDACRLRLGQKLSDLQELRWYRLLPLWPRRQHGARLQDRETLLGDRQPREAETRDRRLPPELLRSIDQRRRIRRDRRRQMGDLYRRCRRLACSQGRPHVHSRQRRSRDCIWRPVHAILP